MVTAQNKARSELATKYAELYRKLFLEEREKEEEYIRTGAYSRTKAITRLISIYPREYRRIYDRYREQGYSHNGVYKKKRG